MDKLKTKIALYKTILGITMGSAVYGGLVYHDYNKNVEHIAEVPSTVRYRLYYGDYLDKELLGDYVPNSDRVDDLVTYEVLEKILYTSFDLNIETDLSVINKMPNLQAISIFNSENLTKEQIDILNNSNLSKITLYFTNVCLHKEDKLDLSLFKNKEEVVINYYPMDELQAVTLLNYLQNYDLPNIKVQYIGNHSNVETIVKTDIMLDQIVASLDIKETDDDKTKLYKIVNYVNNKIEYDKQISQYLSSKEGSIDEYMDLSHYYNDYDLSSIVLKNGNDINGVCVNYANLLDILCYKCGVKSRTIDGATEKVAHAWNVLYLDDEKYYVDLTLADCTYINDRLEEFLNSMDKNTKEELSKKIDSILLQSLKTHSAYSLHTSIDRLDNQGIVKNIYYNQGLDGKEVLHTEIPHKEYVAIGLSSGLLLILSYELLKMLYKYFKNGYVTEEEYYDVPDLEYIDLDNMTFDDEEQDECKIYDFEEYKKKKKKGGN